MFSSFVLAALAAAQSAAPSSSGVKWVPVDEARRAEAPKARTVPQPVIQAVPATPQYVMQAAPIAPISAPATANAVLRVGTEVPLKLSQALTTARKKLRVGDRFHLEVAEAVMVQNVVVIPVGSPAMGEITDARNKGMWGRSGHLAARVLYVTVNGRQIRLSGAFDDKGVAGGVGAVAVSAIVFLPAGFFMTGTSALVPAGTIIKSFVDEDVPLAMPVAAQAPMVVGAPAAPMVVQQAPPH